MMLDAGLGSEAWKFQFAVLDLVKAAVTKEKNE